jgi:hypothetical protein
MSLGFRHIGILACLLVLAACGSSIEPDEPAPSGDASSSASGAGPRADGDDGIGDDGGDGGDAAARAPKRVRNADGSPLEVTGRDVCATLPPPAASRALGVEVDAAAPGDGATPQCTYSYVNADGNDSTFTLAAMRPADIGGRTGLEAFDYMVELSRGLAGPVSLDQEDLAVGDKAVRITGGDVHTGVVAAGGLLLTVTVPERDADAGQVDAAIAAVARAVV